jgi:HTH-type transcriptional regulator / antitoxin HigA
MDTLPFKVIKTSKQYFKYCDLVWEMLHYEKKTRYDEDVIELLTVLIEKWDDEHRTSEYTDPVILLKYMMDEHKMKSVDLAKILDVSTSLISDILNYRRGFSKAIVRKLAEKFKLRQDAFNRPYRLNPPETPPKKKPIKKNPAKVKTPSVSKPRKPAAKIKKTLATV